MCEEAVYRHALLYVAAHERAEVCMRGLVCALMCIGVLGRARLDPVGHDIRQKPCYHLFTERR